MSPWKGSSDAPLQLDSRERHSKGKESTKAEGAYFFRRSTKALNTTRGGGVGGRQAGQLEENAYFLTHTHTHKGHSIDTTSILTTAPEADTTTHSILRERTEAQRHEPHGRSHTEKQWQRQGRHPDSRPQHRGVQLPCPSPAVTALLLLLFSLEHLTFQARRWSLTGQTQRSPNVLAAPTRVSQVSESRESRGTRFSFQ